MQKKPTIDVNKIIINTVTGILIGVMSVTAAISFASLIFSGPLTPYLSTGINFAIFSIITLNIVITIFGHQPVSIAEPQDVTAIFLSIMAATVTAELTLLGLHDRIFPTVFAIIFLTTLLFGLSFFILGKYKWGRFIRFIPYPVTGGFLAGTGSLLIQGAITFITNSTFEPSSLLPALTPQIIAELSATFLYAIFLLIGSRVSNSFLVTPSITGLFLLIFISFNFFSSFSLKNWFLGPFPESSSLIPLLHISSFENINFVSLYRQIPNIAATIMTGLMAMLLNLAGYEAVTKKELDLHREIQTAGTANVLNGLLGGLPGYQSFSLSAIGYTMGANNRIIGGFNVVFAMISIYLGISFFSIFPRSLVAGLLMFFGMQLIVEWLYDSWKKFPRVDYFLVFTIFVIISFAGYLKGVGTGLIVSLIIFAVNYSKTIIKYSLSGDSYHSNVDRSLNQEMILREKGDQILILKLQGFLFFGSIEHLILNIKEKIQSREAKPVKFLILDFKLVTGIDSSAILSFNKVKLMAEKFQFHILITDLSKDIYDDELFNKNLEGFADVFITFKTLDYGLEWCENILLGKDIITEDETVSTLPFQSYLTEMHFNEDEHLIRQGDQADVLYIIKSGKVTVFLEKPNDEKMRIRTMGAGTIVGDIGFYLKLSRTTSVIAEKNTTAYCLSRDALNRMTQEHPEMAAKFHEYVARVLADRIVLSNETVQALMQ